MATTETIRITTDPSQALAGFNRVQQAGQQMAQGIGQAQQSIFRDRSRFISELNKVNNSFRFNQNITQPFDRLRQTFNLTEQETDKLAQGFIRLGAELNRTPEQLAKIAETGKRFGVATQDIEKYTTSVVKLQDQLQNVGQGMVSAGQKLSLATAPLAAGLAVASKQAIDFAQIISNASRALDLSEQEVTAFRSQILKTSPALGMTANSMGELVTEAGKLGVAKKDIMSFAKIVAETAAITDADAVQLAQSFAALQTITGATGKELEIFGSAVNRLDDNIGGTTPEIIEFTRQTAATAKLLKLGIKDIAAYGSTMQSLGIQNGVAYRSFNSLLNKLAASQTLSNKAKKAFSDLGLEAGQMSKIMTTDANQGINLFLTKIKEIAAVDTAKALGAVRQIIGEDYGDEILTLALSHEKLGQALSFTSDTYDKANLAKKNDELAKKLGSVKGQTAIAQAQMQRLSISIGSAFIPSINALLGTLTPLIDKFAEFAEQNPKIVQIGVAIAGIAISTGPVLIAVGSLISAIATIGTVVPAVTTALGGLATVGSGIAAVFAGITLPLWGTLAAFAALGVGIGVLIANWDKLPPSVHQATSQAQFYLKLLVEDIKAFPNNIAQIPDAVGSIMGAIGAKLGGLKIEIGYQLTIIKIQLQNLANDGWNAGIAFISNLGKGIQAQFQFVITNFQQQLATLRGMLPGSEPKIPSPLSNLNKAGSATIQNFASGFNQSSATSALSEALGEMRLPTLSLAQPSIPVATGVSKRVQPSIPVATGGSRGGGNIIINDNRTIQINSGKRDGIDILDALRKSDRELLELIEKARSRWNRGGFF